MDGLHNRTATGTVSLTGQALEVHFCRRQLADIVRNWVGRWAFQTGPSDGPPSYVVKTAALRIYGPTSIWKGHRTEIQIWTRLLPSVCSSPELYSCSLPPIPCYSRSRFHLILQILYPVTLITVIGSKVRYRHVRINIDVHTRLATAGRKLPKQISFCQSIKNLFLAVV
jgi:hypothetical protein